MKNVSFYLLASFIVSCGDSKKTVDTSEVKTPNILFIAVDDLRPELNFMELIILSLQI